MKITKTPSLLLIPLLLLTGIAPTVSVYASPPQPVSGTWGLKLATGTDVINEGGIINRTFVGTWEFTGDIAGTLVGEFIFIINPTGRGTIRGAFTFTGTVLGSEPGEATCVSSGTLEEFFNTLQFTFHEYFTCSRGTGGLAGLHVRGEIFRLPSPSPVPPTARPYSGQAHFDP